jgi:hypothetical protein
VKRSHLGAMLLCILIACSVAFSQSANTSLRGVVKDPAGALVPGASVTILDKSVDKTLSTVSNSAGQYQFAQLPPAKYLITVTAQGFGTSSKTAELLVNQPATIDFTLSMQSNQVTVDVTASAQTLNTTDASMGNSVDNEMIQSMPMDGRDPLSLLSLQPGVLFLGETVTLDMKTTASGVDSRQGAVSGSRSDQGNVTLDGVDDNDQISGFAFNGVLRSTLDSTEEFRVTTSNSNADAGRSSGAQIALITKSGTNRLHGSAYEYHRPSNTVANDWFLKEQQLSSGDKNRPTKYIVNTYGGSAGGPFWKDKLFFFANYEAQRLATNKTVSATTPSATFLNGQLGYFTDTGAVQLLTPDQIAQLDKNCTRCTTPGVNQAILSYLGTEPAATVLAGGDGINNGTLNFSSPAPSRLNTSIVKIDYNLNSRNHIFARGNLQKDTLAGAENLPGQPPSDTYSDNSKGMAFGETFTLGSSIVNDIRYAYIRQGFSDTGIGQGDYVSVRFLTQPTAQSRSSIVNVPVHTIVDNLSITKGAHNISLGGSWRMVGNNTATNASSFNGASTNPSFLNAKDAPDPTDLGLPAVGANFISSFNQAYATIVGDVAERTSNANYKVTSLTSADLLPDGALINRHFKGNEFEYYIQDSWRIKPNLTLTFGIRHTLLQTPYETKGQQIAPTVDTHEWFLNRGKAAAVGATDQPDLFFAPVGKANGRPAFWPKQKLNIAPRFAVVYAPNQKTSIRAGVGMYYDHYGEALSKRFATLGSFGLANNFQSPAGAVKFEEAPRFTGPHDLPDLPIPASPASQAYPYAVPDGAFGINWGIDNHVHTPYVEAFNLSVQREIPGGFLLDVAYVGRLGRHLFQQIDLAEPTNLNDPKGAGDYFTAASQLSKDVDLNGGAYGGIFTDDPAVHVPTIQYFEDVFPQMKDLDYVGESATDATYNAEWAPYRYNYGETQGLVDIDFACYYGCPNGTQFWNQQFSSLISLSSIGMSYYNALQVSLRHPSKHGLSADFSYTYSRSIDMGSDAERSATSYGAIQNSWNPSLSRGVSDFDTTHMLTMDWAYSLPFGRGKMLGNTGALGDALWGGWQWAGVGRWTSGLPFSLIEPGWTTNWELQAWAVPTQKVKLHKHIKDGLPQIFADDVAVDGGIYNGSPVRLPYPGEAGPRNNFRGDGVFDVDSSLSKTWNLMEKAKLKFAWEVYNVSNSIRFDTASLGNGLTYQGFGFYSARLGDKTFRRMQFGLRLDF